jgi:hypothetical protein
VSTLTDNNPLLLVEGLLKGLSLTPNVPIYFIYHIYQLIPELSNLSLCSSLYVVVLVLILEEVVV